MNLQCIICSDPINSGDNIFSTPCGHLFHHACLMQWIIRSKTCPQCRLKTTDKTIHRVFFNVANTDHISDDVGALQFKLDGKDYQLRMKELDIKNLSEKYQTCKKQKFALKEEVVTAERKLKSNEGMVFALKDQVSYFKSKCKEQEKLASEIMQLKSRLRDADAVHLAINGTREEVNEMLRNDNNPEALALLASTLKKTLVETERRKSNQDSKVKELQREVNRGRRENEVLQRQVDLLSKELESLKSNWTSEKSVLTGIVKDIHGQREAASGLTPIINRILTESPMPIAIKHRKLAESPIDLTASDENCGFTQNTPKIVSGVSGKPPVSVSMDGSSYRRALTDKSRSIFRPKRPVGVMKMSADICADGLGGHSKEHVFPTGRSQVLKRTKTSSDVTANKYRKLGGNN